MSFLMICDDKNNTGKGDASMLKKYRVNLSDINDLDIFKKINNVYFDTNEDRLPQKKNRPIFRYRAKDSTNQC